MLFSGPEAHAANPPDSWVVVKVVDRCWHLRTKDGGVLETRTTRRAAEECRTSGFVAELYEKERRWFAGENVHPWRPWAEIEAERAAREAS